MRNRKTCLSRKHRAQIFRKRHGPWETTKSNTILGVPCHEMLGSHGTACIRHSPGSPPAAQRDHGACCSSPGSVCFTTAEAPLPSQQLPRAFWMAERFPKVCIMTTNESVCSSTETNLQEQFQRALKEITSRMVLPRFLDTPRLHKTGSTPLVSSNHSHGQVTLAPLCSARARRTAPDGGQGHHPSLPHWEVPLPAGLPGALLSPFPQMRQHLQS